MTCPGKSNKKEQVNVVHGSKGTWREWMEGGAEASEFYTMDYSHVQRRRPIHNKSMPDAPWNMGWRREGRINSMEYRTNSTFWIQFCKSNVIVIREMRNVSSSICIVADTMEQNPRICLNNKDPTPERSSNSLCRTLIYRPFSNY